MRVTLFTKNWQPRVGGIERYLQSTVTRLSSEFDYRVVHPKFFRGDKFGVLEAISLVFLGVFCSFRKADVIQLGDLTMWVFARISIIRNPKARIVAFAHGTEIAFANGKSLRRRLYRIYISTGHKFLSEKATTVCNSMHTQGLCRKLGYQDLVLIHPGMDETVTKCDCGDVNVDKDELLYVGRFVRRKGLHWFAGEVLPYLDPEIKLAIAGPIQSLSTIEELLLNPRIRYLGQPKDCCLSKIRSQSLAVIVPTLNSEEMDFEGFGMTAIEASRDKAIVLVGHAEGSKDAVIDGVTGFALSSGNKDVWVSKIQEIWTWPNSKKTAFTNAASEASVRVWNWTETSMIIGELFRGSKGKSFNAIEDK